MPNSSLHIGVATFHQMHILLTWNIRHIANAHVREDLRVLIASLGYTNGEVRSCGIVDGTTLWCRISFGL
jgi:hypothetical protein